MHTCAIEYIRLKIEIYVIFCKNMKYRTVCFSFLDNYLLKLDNSIIENKIKR